MKPTPAAPRHRVLFVCNYGITSGEHARDFNRHLKEAGLHKRFEAAAIGIERAHKVSEQHEQEIIDSFHIVSVWAHNTPALKRTVGNIGIPITSFASLGAKGDWRKELVGLLKAQEKREGNWLE